MIPANHRIIFLMVNAFVTKYDINSAQFDIFYPLVKNSTHNKTTICNINDDCGRHEGGEIYVTYSHDKQEWLLEVHRMCFAYDIEPPMCIPNIDPVDSQYARDSAIIYFRTLDNLEPYLFAACRYLHIIRCDSRPEPPIIWIVQIEAMLQNFKLILDREFADDYHGGSNLTWDDHVWQDNAKYHMSEKYFAGKFSTIWELFSSEATESGWQDDAIDSADIYLSDKIDGCISLEYCKDDQMWAIVLTIKRYCNLELDFDKIMSTDANDVDIHQFHGIDGDNAYETQIKFKNIESIAVLLKRVDMLCKFLKREFYEASPLMCEIA